MSFLSAAELDRMRHDVAQMLPDTAVLLQEVRTPNSAGKWTSAWAPVAGGTIPCRVGPLRGRIVQPDAIAQREAVLNIFLLVCAWDAPLAADQRVLHGGLTYEVRQVLDAHSWRVSKQAYILRID